jgi:trehalose 6-phosphate phosphatase
MRNVLGSGGRERLAALMAECPLVGFDFDGTLVALSEHPSEVGLTADTRTLLIRLAERVPVVVITGRSRADVSARLEGVPLFGIAGNHGVEPFGETPDVVELVAEWHAALLRDFAKLPGIAIEDKRFSLTVDYRHAPDMEATRDAIHAAAKRLPRARLLGGRHADFNIAPDGAPNKGTALTAFMQMAQRTAAIYVGDDRTDEDAFRLELPSFAAIRVGRREHSAAPFFLEAQTDMDRLIETLLDGAPDTPERPA